MTDPPLRIGLLGVGRGASQLLPALTSSPHGRLVAAADLSDAVREKLTRDYGVPTYASAEELCNNGNVEAVWVATPNQFHAEHAITVARHGEQRHIDVEEELRGAAELRELYQAVRHQQPLTHDGAWGEATLEVCLAINESARTRTEIRLAG